MTIIDTNILKEAIYNLCLQAGQEISPCSYNKILEQYKKTKSNKLLHILQNAHKAHKTQRPLCQDTGTVHVFLEVGNEISFSSNPTEAINEGVKDCYIKNYFRKSIVENELISGKNNEMNIPALITTEYVTGDKLIINVLLKGAGCDNVSDVKMLLPTTTKEELENILIESISERAKNACPPCFISVAVGSGAESVMTEAEKAFFNNKNDLPEIADKIKNKINSESENNFLIADLKITAKNHHMASLPLAIAFNCHSLRIASATIENNKIKYSAKINNFENFIEEEHNFKEVNTASIEEIRNLHEGENILLTGEILIARDAAHKKMLQYKKENKKLPFELQDKIIFYAAPCSKKEGEIVGSIGPTTSKRMDKFLPEFPQICATIGKGERTKQGEEIIRKNNSVYFEAEGGIATLLSSCFESYQTIAFKELSTEAVCIAKIKKLPLKVKISNPK
jgi:fumarate hydratase class I